MTRQPWFLYLCIAFLMACYVAYWFGYLEAEQRYTTAAVCPNPEEIALAKQTRTPIDTTECQR